jgi:outer membrane receptor protein involved in Fe transport
MSVLLSFQPIVAQTASNSSDDSDINQKEKIISLSPFVVSSEDGTGYQARQTMVGSRTAKDLIDIPASVGMVNLEQLSDLGAISVHDALRYTVSGVTQNQSFNDDVNIRGFRAGSALRNGAVRNAGNKGGPLYDIERIEVLKGPAAMLNGSNGGIGGSINYISRKPTATKKGEIKISVNEIGAARLQANATGPLYADENLKVNYRLTLGALNSDAPRGKKIEWEDQKFYGGALAFYFGSASSLTVNAYYWINNDYLYLLDHLDISVPANATTGLIDAKFNKYSTVEYAPGRKQDAFWPLKSSAIDVTYLVQLTDNTNVRAAYYYNRHDDRRENNRGITVAADNKTVNRQDIRNNNGNTSQSFQIDVLNKLKFSFVTIDTSLGVDGGISDSWQDQSVATNMPPADSSTGVPPNDDAWFAQFPNDDAYFINRPASVAGPAPSRTTTYATQLSYYIQENLSFWNDRIVLVGGLRWFQPGGTTKNLVTGVISDRPDDKFRVHKYGAVFKIMPTLSVYYTDAQNVFPASPGRTDKFIQADMLGDPYKDSLGKLKEGGLKFDHKFSDNLSAYGTLAVFKMEQTNIRTFGVLPDSGNMGLIQSAKDSAEGWETDLGLQLKTDNGRADLLFTYFSGDSAIAADEGKAYVRQTNAFVPEKFSAFGKFTWTEGPLKSLRIGGGIETEADKRYGGYLLSRPLLADAFVGYSVTSKLDLQLNLSNITDERYILQTAASGLVQGSDIFHAKLTATYKW